MKYLLEMPIRGRIGTEKFRSAIHWRNGILITDEPKKIGGKDLGPDPYTLLLSSLVSCTLATLRMYIEHKRITVPEIVIEANMFERIGKEGNVVYIERKIEIRDGIDLEIRERLIRVAEHCPVSKILKGSISIATKFTE